MINKKYSSDPIDNLEYEKVLEEEIINSYESKFQKDTEEDIKKIKFMWNLFTFFLSLCV